MPRRCRPRRSSRPGWSGWTTGPVRLSRARPLTSSSSTATYRRTSATSATSRRCSSTATGSTARRYVRPAASAACPSDRLTLPEFVADLGQQVDFAGPYGRVGPFAHRLVGRPDHQEDDEGENDEADDFGDEGTPAEDGRAGFLERCIVRHRTVVIRRDGAEQQEMAREIEAAENLADDRHDDVFGQAGDDLAECCADDHGDGEIEHVAFHDECPEFLEHDSPLAWCRVGDTS